MLNVMMMLCALLCGLIWLGWVGEVTPLAVIRRKDFTRLRRALSANCRGGGGESTDSWERTERSPFARLQGPPLNTRDRPQPVFIYTFG